MAEVDEHVQTQGSEQSDAGSGVPERAAELKATSRWGTGDRDPGGDAA